MPKFNYVAMDTRGKETKGTLDVASQSDAINRLKEMGFFPTKVMEAEKPKDPKADKKNTKSSALAKGKKAELVTADTEFKAVEKEIKINWLK